MELVVAEDHQRLDHGAQLVLARQGAKLDGVVAGGQGLGGLGDLQDRLAGGQDGDGRDQPDHRQGAQAPQDGHHHRRVGVDLRLMRPGLRRGLGRGQGLVQGDRHLGVAVFER